LLRNFSWICDILDMKALLFHLFDSAFLACIRSLSQQDSVLSVYQKSLRFRCREDPPFHLQQEKYIQLLVNHDQGQASVDDRSLWVQDVSRIWNQSRIWFYR